MIYAGFHNLQQSDKAARQEESRRSSRMQSFDNTNIHTIETKKEKSTLKKILDQFKATEETIAPTGFYTPIIRRGPLFHSNKVADEKRGSTSSSSSVASL